MLAKKDRIVLGVALVETRAVPGPILNLACDAFTVERQSGGWGILYRPDSTRKWGVKIHKGDGTFTMLTTSSGAIRTFADSDSAVKAAKTALGIRP